jgi:hypothetical protein
MRICSAFFLAAALWGQAALAVKVQNVKVVVAEKGKSPVSITVPYWVAKSTAQISELVDAGNEHIPVQKILAAIENAPQLGTIMTIEKKDQKITISVE